MSEEATDDTKNRRWFWIIPLILALAFHFNVLQNGFGWDVGQINKQMESASIGWKAFLPSFDAPSPSNPIYPYYRPMVSVSYILDYKLWGGNPMGYHFSVWAGHGLNAVLVFFLTRRLLRVNRSRLLVYSEDNKKLRNWKLRNYFPFSIFSFSDSPPAPTPHSPLPTPFFIPLIAASLFAVLPIHAEAVAWIPGRSDVFCTTFLLLCFLLFLRSYESLSAVPYLASLLFFWFALLTKETAMTFILLFPICDDWVYRNKGPAAAPSRTPSRSGLRVAIRWIGPLFILGIYALGRVDRVTSPFQGPSPSHLGTPSSYAEGIAAFGYYLKMLLFPYPHNPFVSGIPTSPLVLALSLFGLSLLAGGILWCVYRRLFLFGFALSWMTLSLLPAVAVSMLHLGAAPVAERYVYTASVGFLIVVMGLIIAGYQTIQPAIRSSRPVWGIGIVGGILLIIVLGVDSWNRNAIWKSSRTFWEAAVKASPQAGYAHTQLGGLYLGEGEEALAESYYLKALALDEGRYGSDHFRVSLPLQNLANLYFRQRNFREAEELYRRAITIREASLGLEHPVLAMSVNNLGVLYRMENRFLEAESLHKRALQIREASLGPNHQAVATSLNNLAVLYYLMGDHSRSESHFHRALDILERVLGTSDPKTIDTLKNYAALLREMNRDEEAQRLEEAARESGAVETGDWRLGTRD